MNAAASCAFNTPSRSAGPMYGEAVTCAENATSRTKRQAPSWNVGVCANSRLTKAMKNLRSRIIVVHQ